ncbi:MAG TPA: hypothetical protein VJZ32_08660 [Candidatus Bathyarchaeia archaeon]|nr:hypothetical protein [Candidatus Bathyarchaeia archaeon]
MRNLKLVLVAAVAKIYVYLWFDIEDYVTGESHDLPLTAFRILKKYKIPVTCKIVAEKVRALQESGRNDVIDAISEYDVGYHLDTHSRHPTVYEFFAEADVRSGAKEFLVRERYGLAFVKQVFGRNMSCFGHPGPAWAPHVYPALSDVGIPVYLDETSILNLGNRPYWYCGVLNLNGANRNFILFDYSFEDPSGINRLKRRFKTIYDRLRMENGSAISILFHLHTSINKKFWDEVNFGYGKNRFKEDYERPPAQPPEVTKRAWRDFEEFIRYVKQFNVQFITARDAERIYGQAGPRTLDSKRLKLVSKHFSVSTDYLATKQFVISPAEAFFAVNYALDRFFTSGKIEQFELQEPLGPMTTFRSRGSKKLQTKDIVTSIQTILEFINVEKVIPSHIKIGKYAVLSPEDFLATASKLLRRTLDGQLTPTAIRASKGKQPHLKYINDANFRKACRWKVLPHHFEAPKILEQIKLQAWTLKPAMRVSGET